jgi:hypothetical protein
MQINLRGFITRGGRELLEVDLVCPSSNDVGHARIGHAMNKLLLATAAPSSSHSLRPSSETAKPVGQFEMSNRRDTACCRQPHEGYRYRSLDEASAETAFEC